MCSLIPFQDQKRTQTWREADLMYAGRYFLWNKNAHGWKRKHMLVKIHPFSVQIQICCVCLYCFVFIDCLHWQKPLDLLYPAI